MTEVYVLDSFAILSLLNDETGSDIVAQILQQVRGNKAQASMTWVNVGEIAYIVERRWGAGKLHQILAFLEATGIDIVPAERHLALSAAHIKALHPLAYADSFAAALAVAQKATLVTGDPEFKQLDETVPILWIA